jgi:glycosyltransferase involved in cell wall biosynthesis
MKLNSSESLKTPELSVILPICNEVDNLGPLMNEIALALDPINRSYEVLMVDDGSTDGSRAEIKRLANQYPNLRGLLFRANRGQTAAFDAGFREARGSIIVTMDADRQNDPKDILPMLKFIDEGYDFVAGWRKQRQDGFLLRRLPSLIANWIIRRVTKTKIRDLGCSLKMYRKEITDELRLYGEMHRFIGPLCEMLGAKVAEVETHHRPRVAGVSKYNLSRTFKVMMDLLTIWFFRSFETKPLYVFGGLATLLFFIGSCSWIFVLYEKYYLDVWVHRNPLFILGLVLFVISMQFAALGLIAESLMRTYFESQSRRPYSIAEKIGY